MNDDHAPASTQPDKPADSWQPLQKWTAARIALGRVGGSIPYPHVLDFRLAHARARDAVLRPFDTDAMARQLRALHPHILLARSAATSRAEYLQRPDKGRRLAPETETLLTQTAREFPQPDLVIIISDGLSACAAEQQIVPTLTALLPLLKNWKLAPLLVVPFARVAIQDQIGELLKARLALILLGERPGLGSPDSLGAYLVHSPRLGNTDAHRNCLSNIRPAGLPPAEAASKIFQLLSDSRQLGFSGVDLKEGSVLPPALSS